MSSTERPARTHRKCGDCQLCCKLVPVASLGKQAGHRCKYQRVGLGCTVYKDLPRVAPECRLWSCQWLVDPDPEAAKMHRPDRVHYVIDLLPDFINAIPEGGEAIQYSVMQVWVDPAFPQAADAPELLAWVEHIAETRGQATLIRFGAGDGYTLWAPCLTSDGQWHRKGGTFRKDVGLYSLLRPEHQI
jgi:hypothetical protein